MRGPENESIFGDTYNGVPNPQTPHTHPYPTRFHGPIWTWPVFGMPWRENTYAQSPYMGLGVTWELAPGVTPPPPPAPKPDNTMLYVGIGVGAIALGGAVYWKMKHKKAATPNRRRRRAH